jgi:hypothetical protein
VTYLPVCGVEVAMVARLYAPSLPRRTPRGRARLAVTVAVVLLAVVGGLLLTGVQGRG